MSLLIQSAKIIDPSSPHHGKTRNILIVNGKIERISSDAQSAKKVIDAKGCLLSPGWMDFRAFLGEPGFEHLETLDSGTKAAAAGGFTALACMSNTAPPIQNKETIHSIKSRNGQRVTAIHPIAALSKDLKGKELTEILDLNSAGVQVFSDGYRSIADPSLLVKALQYNQIGDSLTVDFPIDEKLAKGAQVHESIQSTQLGLKSTPSFHETIRINRDIEILRYTGGRLHISNISTKEGVGLIKKAKREGLNISCDVAISHLAFNEEKVADFDTNAKVNPPLRLKKDQKALWKALEEGVIDVIASNHLPLDEECKKLEFDLADFGMSTLEVFLPMLQEYQEIKDWDTIIQAIVRRPRELSGLEVPIIEEGELADITVFDPQKSWVYDAKSRFSLSKNSPLYDKEIKGKVLATIHGKNEYIAHV